MSWKDESTKFESAPVGTHLARCVRVIDIGTQTGEYKGEKTVARKNIIYWELPNELREDGKPFMVSKFYTASLGEKANLRKDLVNWRGREFTPDELRGFEESNILDKCCQVTITEKESGKRVVSGIAGVPKGVEVPERMNPIMHFSLDNFDQELYDSLSDGIKKLIKESAEFASLGVVDTEPQYSGENQAKSAAASTSDDDIPF